MKQPDNTPGTRFHGRSVMHEDLRGVPSGRHAPIGTYGRAVAFVTETWCTMCLTGRGAPRLAIIMVLMLASVQSSAIPPHQHFDYRVGMVVAEHQFSLAAWEIGALADKMKQAVIRRASSLSPSELEDLVPAFFVRVRIIGELEGELQRVHSLTAANKREETIESLQRELDALRQQRDRDRGLVETILEHQVANTLADEGFAVGPLVWPPVSFRLDDPPTLLIISPREEIVRRKEVILDPALPSARREKIENAIDLEFDVSSLVDDLGGLGAVFPTIVLFSSSILHTADTVAHEWAHQYLFFNPLGWRYGTNRDLTTMNETAASLVGEEIAYKVMVRYYPDLAAPHTGVTHDASTPRSDQETRVDFNSVLRETRLEVDRLLVAGDVEGAEVYMESQRRLLVENGIYLRKLNQAYFAFHGSYATSPASPDPIGPQMRELRSASPSLKAFLQQVAQMRSYDDLCQAVQEKQVD
jgi:hypothetical protein